jgi:hypothetical protein
MKKLIMSLAVISAMTALPIQSYAQGTDNLPPCDVNGSDLCSPSPGVVCGGGNGVWDCTHTLHHRSRLHKTQANSHAHKYTAQSSGEQRKAG